MYRFTEEKINKWIDKFDTSFKGLLIYGARQVGKTYTIRKVLKERKLKFFEINLFENPKILKSLKACEEAKDITKIIELYSNIELDSSSVVFIDEIQVFPEIITKIKFLVDEKKHHYIFSGSNLGVELHSITSIPVGYFESFKMYPMSFFEFLIANKAKGSSIEYLKNCYRSLEKIDNVIFEKVVRLFYYYLAVGGMPECVSIYTNSLNLNEIDKEQKNIINQYKADFTQYESLNKRLKIISIYDNIPTQLNKQNRRFAFNILNKELKFERYEESFLWLKDASVALSVFNIDTPKPPLKNSASSNLFKLYLSDVGLLTSMYEIEVKKTIIEMNKDKILNNGSLFENFVCQMLCLNNSVYYYKSKTIGEIDFITEIDGKILPIEVKSGSDYKKHPSLNHLLDKREFNIQKGIVLSLNNIEINGKITYLPIFYAELIQNSTLGDIKLEKISDFQGVDKNC